jgi:hypothetical protein
VHTGDLDGVLGDHDDDIVMFDVPPPHEGVRGVATHADTWPLLPCGRAEGRSQHP